MTENEGWTDTDGHVFIYFTIEALAETLHKSQMTVKNALSSLEKQKLILRKRQGPGHPNRNIRQDNSSANLKEMILFT